MINETYNKMVAIAQAYELMTLVEFADLLEDANYDKREACKEILNAAFAAGIRSDVYSHVKGTYNEFLKAAA